MENKEYLSVAQLCTVYKIEMSFFEDLAEHDLVQIVSVKQGRFVHEAQIQRVEQIIRLYQELEVNFAGIDVILNLIEKVEEKDREIVSLRNRLRLFDEE